MSIFFVRHTSVNVPRGICYGQTDVPLSDSFEQEAIRVKEALEELHIEKAYTSPLSRCVRLADFCGFPEAKRDRRLLELDFGQWEMQAFESIVDPRLQTWYDNYLHTPTMGGEAFTDLYARVASFLSEIKKRHPYSPTAVFTHGGVLTCVRILTGNAEAEEAFRTIPPYGSILPLNNDFKIVRAVL